MKTHHLKIHKRRSIYFLMAAVLAGQPLSAHLPNLSGLAVGGLYQTSSSKDAVHKATIRETTETLKTYPFSDPNPVANPSALMYPYFRFDGFSAKGVEKEWKSVVLENDFIRLNLFPEVGGKIWGAVDKTSGKEFIYTNHVAKFRDIAMRGPWTSGGIELNFGIIGHAPTSTTPIDYYTEEKADGSVSCHIASYEWVTRTYWNVEVNLQKDKAYFTTTTTWYNQSDLDQPYYQWMNAGYKAAGNAHFCYPGNTYIGHGGDAHPFPKDESGRDLSWYKNNNFGSSKSEHVLGFYNDYYGIYWEDDDFGSVHHADYTDKLGMKIFLWGQARDGSIWEDLLTDTDGQYIELQSGRMFNQPASGSAYSPFKHHAFGAQQTDRWTEYWYPVKGIQGISKASRIGALKVTRQGSDLQLGFSPLEALNTTLRIYKGEEEVTQLSLQTQVLQPWEKRLTGLGDIPQGELRVVIGEQELVYSERPNDYLLHRPMALPDEFDWNSTYGLYTQGEQAMNQKRDAEAEKFLKQALAKEACFAPALNRLASLYLRHGRLDEAVVLLKKSLSLNTYDAEANYLFGLYNLRYKHTADAKAAFSIATYSQAFRSAAYTKLAELALREKAWKQAEAYALRSLTTNSRNLDARQVLMVAYRKLNEPEKADVQIRQVLAEMPLYHMARYEQFLQQGVTSLHQQGEQTFLQNGLSFHQKAGESGQQSEEFHQQHSGQSLQHSGQSLQHSGQSLQHSGQSLQHSGQSLQHSGQSLQHSGQSLQHSGQSLHQHTAESVADFQSLVRNELPFETYLELAGWYESVGCEDEALQLLTCADAHPIALYKRAFILHQQGKESESGTLLQQAEQASPSFIFPFRPETDEALLWASSVSSDWKIGYYRGLIAAANQRSEEALKYFESCENPDYAPFYLCRAELRKAAGTVTENYLDDLLKAESIDKSWRSSFALLKAYTELNDWEKVVETGRKSMRKYPSNYYLALKLAKGYCETGRYKESLSLLRKITVLPNEGSYIGRAAYREANIYQSLDCLKRKRFDKSAAALRASMEWPENLGVGKPYDELIDSRLEDYLQARILVGEGQASQARDAFHKVAESRFAKAGFKSGHLLTAWALRELGRQQEADEWVKSWQQLYPNHKIAQWCTYVYRGDKACAAQMLKDQKEQADATPWESTGRDADFALIVRLVSMGLSH